MLLHSSINVNCNKRVRIQTVQHYICGFPAIAAVFVLRGWCIMKPTISNNEDRNFHEYKKVFIKPSGDNESAHQPLAMRERKRWGKCGTVLWILFISLVSFAAGVAFWYCVEKLLLSSGSSLDSTKNQGHYTGIDESTAWAMRATEKDVVSYNKRTYHITSFHNFNQGYSIVSAKNEKDTLSCLLLPITMAAMYYKGHITHDAPYIENALVTELERSYVIFKEKVSPLSRPSRTDDHLNYNNVLMNLMCDDVYRAYSTNEGWYEENGLPYEFSIMTDLTSSLSGLFDSSLDDYKEVNLRLKVVQFDWELKGSL